MTYIATVSFGGAKHRRAIVRISQTPLVSVTAFWVFRRWKLWLLEVLESGAAFEGCLFGSAGGVGRVLLLRKRGNRSFEGLSRA